VLAVALSITFGVSALLLVAIPIYLLAVLTYPREVAPPAGTAHLPPV
jgi:hypothetical protein